MKSLKETILAVHRGETLTETRKPSVSSLPGDIDRKGSHDVMDSKGKVVKSYPYTNNGMKAAIAHVNRLKEELEEAKKDVTAAEIEDGVDEEDYEDDKDEDEDEDDDEDEDNYDNEEDYKKRHKAVKEAFNRLYEKKEEVELHELSQERLKNFHAKAGADRLKAKDEVLSAMKSKKPTEDKINSATKSYARFIKRGAGMTAAAKKMVEETELNELSREVTRSYIRKAIQDNKERKAQVEKPFKLKDIDKNVSDHKKYKKRESSIELAGKKAYGIGGGSKVRAHEEVENLGELSSARLDAYTDKARAEVAKMSKDPNKALSKKIFNRDDGWRLAQRKTNAVRPGHIRSAKVKASDSDYTRNKKD